MRSISRSVTPREPRALPGRGVSGISPSPRPLGGGAEPGRPAMAPRRTARAASCLLRSSTSFQLR
eukprot:3368559-Alexandrium_andersonii.AAC.1